MIQKITSLGNERIKAARALHMRKERAATGQFLCEGLKIIVDALDQGFVPEVLIMGPQADPHPQLKRAITATEAKGGVVLEVTLDILKKITRKDNPQMVAGVFAQIEHPLSALNPGSARVWVGLEAIRDPGNLGTIIRTADAAGCGGVILIGDCVDPFGVETVRATMGSIFSVPIFRCSVPDFIAFRASWPGPVIGTLLSAAHSHRTAPYGDHNLIVMGTEQSGLSPALQALCDLNVKIPMRGRADSLNLAVATAIMIYEAAETTGPRNPPG
jgi:RNA methyltransferase, TrmH family